MDHPPAVGSVWARGSRSDPLTLAGDGVVVVTASVEGVWGARCTTLPLGGGGPLTGPARDALYGRAYVGAVAHAFTEAELRDPSGAAAQRLRDGALALARWWIMVGSGPRPDVAG